MIYKVKALVRWLRYSLRVGVSYHDYSQGSDVGGYVGWYESRGQCIAFRDVDGGVQFLW